MRITILLILLVAIEASIDLPSRAARSVWFAQMKNSGDAPELNGLRLLFKGQPVDEVVTSKNIKKYSIELTGTGFLPASTVVVDSIRAFPVTAGDPPQQPTSAAFVGATSFEVRFSPDTAPPPGMLSVRVVNPDGAESNPLTVDVISKASKLSISSISPQTGPVGTQVTLTGNGFTPIPPSNVIAIRITPVAPQDHRFVDFFEGFFVYSPTESGTLTFALPNWLIEPICPGSPFVCDPIASPPVTAGLYRISVINPNGMSNSILFDVTSE